MSDELETYKQEIERLNGIISELTQRVEQFEYILQKVQQATSSQNDTSTNSIQKRSSWEVDEHRRFVDAVRSLGRQKAKEISATIETRSAVQVHSHSQKYFLKIEAIVTESIALTQQAQISTFRPTEGLQLIGSLPKHPNDLFPLLLPKICMIDKGYYFAGSFGRRNSSIIPIQLLRIGIKQLLTHFKAKFSFQFDGLLDLKEKQLQIIQNALQGVQSDGEDDIDVFLSFSSFQNFDKKQFKKQVIYYKPDQILPLLELVVVWFISTSDSVDKAIYQCFQSQFIFQLACNQLQDSIEQNIKLVSIQLEISEDYCAALLLAKYVFNAFVSQ